MYKKKTAAFAAAGFSVDTRPVTQAKQTDMPVALVLGVAKKSVICSDGLQQADDTYIIRTLLPKRSTVKAQMIPPNMMQA